MAVERLQTDTIHFGELIRDTLHHTNLSTRFLSSEMGYTDVHLYRIFHKEDVNTEILRKVCRVTNTELSTLLTRAMSGININSGNTSNSHNYASSEGGGLNQQIGSSNYEADKLQATIDILNMKVNSLESTIASKDEMLKMKDEIITLYKASSK
jgi:hypothetical protein